MVGYHLAEAGIDAIVLEKRDIAAGSTSASTALVMYEIDEPLKDLIRCEERTLAVKSYRQCLESTDKMEIPHEKSVLRLWFHAEEQLAALRAASADVGLLKEECETRQKYGFKVDYLERRDIESNFSFSRPAGSYRGMTPKWIHTC